MKYLHTMIRVSDPEETLRFFSLLGLEEVRRMDNEKGRFTLIFLAAPGDGEAQIELTHNWDEAGYGEGRNFGHVAYEVDDVYETCAPADGRPASPSTGRRARAGWPSSAPPTAFRSSCSRKAAISRSPSPGRRCRMSGIGEQAGRTGASPICSAAACRSSPRRWPAPPGSSSRWPRSRAARSARCPARC